MKNIARINLGLRKLSQAPYEIMSGTVVAGSVDTTHFTMSVNPSEGGEPIDGVLLNSSGNNADGAILFPADESQVIIGTIDGPGEWVLLRAGTINKAKIVIGGVSFMIDNSQTVIANGDVVFNIGSSVFKMNTASESLYNLLTDLITYITVLTVPTSGGASGVPLNVYDFTNLLTRLNNLLTN